VICADKHIAFDVKVRWLCQISTVIENVREFLLKFSSIRVYENSFTRSRFVTRVQMGRRQENFNRRSARMRMCIKLWRT
jgi:hypothetical protein